MVGIEHIEYYLPDDYIEANQYLYDLLEKQQLLCDKNNIDFFLETSGYNTIKVEKNMNRIEMIEKVFNKLSLIIDFGLIDYVIYSTDIPESYIDKKVYPLYFINKFNLKNANYFAMNQQCGTQLNAINIGKLLIMQEQANRVLVISSNIKRMTDNRFINGFGIVGDGAVGLILQKSSRMNVQNFVSITQSEYYDLKQTPIGGNNYMKYLNHGITSISNILKRNNLTLKDISYIIPQNVNRVEWDYYCRKLEFSKNKVFLENISKYGHIGDCDALINLKDFLSKYNFQLKSNENILLQSVGAGATFNTMLVTV